MPTASKNLISFSCLAQEGYVISFYKDHCNIFYENNKVANGFVINGLYQLHVDVSVFNIEQCWCKNPLASEKLESRKSWSPSGPAKEV